MGFTVLYPRIHLITLTSLGSSLGSRALGTSRHRGRCAKSVSRGQLGWWPRWALEGGEDPWKVSQRVKIYSNKKTSKGAIWDIWHVMCIYDCMYLFVYLHIDFHYEHDIWWCVLYAFFFTQFDIWICFKIWWFPITSKEPIGWIWNQWNLRPQSSREGHLVEISRS